MVPAAILVDVLPWPPRPVGPRSKIGGGAPVETHGRGVAMKVLEWLCVDGRDDRAARKEQEDAEEQEGGGRAHIHPGGGSGWVGDWAQLRSYR